MDEQVSMRLPDRQYTNGGGARLHAGVLVLTFMLQSIAILLDGYLRRGLDTDLFWRSPTRECRAGGEKEARPWARSEVPRVVPRSVARALSGCLRRSGPDGWLPRRSQSL